MNSEPLVRAVVAALLVLEESGDDQIDPDVAVRGLENISYELLKLDDGGRAEFKAVCERVAQAESNPAVADFVRLIPSHVGI